MENWRIHTWSNSGLNLSKTVLVRACTKQIKSSSETFILCNVESKRWSTSSDLNRVKLVIKEKTFPVKITDLRPSLIKHMENWRIYTRTNSGPNLSKTV